MANSNEDGKLSKSARVTKIRPWSDIDLSFTARTGTDGDVFKKTDVASVKQSIKTLLLTNAFEKPYRPSFGGDLSELLFEPADEDTGEQLPTQIKNAIARYEPRARIINLDIVAKSDQYTVDVILEFRIVNTGVTDVLKLVLGAAEDCEPDFFPSPPLLDPSEDRILGQSAGGTFLFLVTEGGGFLNFDDDIPGVYD